MTKFDALYNKIISQQNLFPSFELSDSKIEADLNNYSINDRARINILLGLKDGNHIINNKEFQKIGTQFKFLGELINANKLNQILGSQYKEPLNQIQKAIIELKKHGNTVNLTDEQNKVIVLNAFVQNGESKNDQLIIDSTGLITSNTTGDTYKDIFDYLNY